MKYGTIPDTDIRFKIGDVIEVPNYSGDYELDSLFGRITKIEDTVLDIRGYYCLYVNGGSTYYRSSEVIRWYRKNRKGILVPFCDQELEDKIWKEKHKDDKPDPRWEKLMEDMKDIIDNIFKEEPKFENGKVKIKKFKMDVLPFYKLNKEK